MAGDVRTGADLALRAGGHGWCPHLGVQLVRHLQDRWRREGHTCGGEGLTGGGGWVAGGGEGGDHARGGDFFYLLEIFSFFFLGIFRFSNYPDMWDLVLVSKIMPCSCHLSTDKCPARQIRCQLAPNL
jgi:hypothetical protein